MTNATRKWIRAGLETVIHGGCAAISSSVISTAIDAKDWGPLSPNGLKMIVGTFAINGGLRFIQWWQNNPLPPDGDTGQIAADAGSIVPQQVISLNPLAKVQTLSIPTSVAPSPKSP